MPGVLPTKGESRTAIRLGPAPGPQRDPLPVNAYPAACAIADHRLPFVYGHRAWLRRVRSPFGGHLLRSLFRVRESDSGLGCRGYGARVLGPVGRYSGHVRRAGRRYLRCGPGFAMTLAHESGQWVIAARKHGPRHDPRWWWCLRWYRSGLGCGCGHDDGWRSRGRI